MIINLINLFAQLSHFFFRLSTFQKLVNSFTLKAQIGLLLIKVSINLFTDILTKVFSYSHLDVQIFKEFFFLKILFHSTHAIAVVVRRHRSSE